MNRLLGTLVIVKILLESLVNLNSFSEALVNVNRLLETLLLLVTSSVLLLQQHGLSDWAENLIRPFKICWCFKFSLA